MKKQLIENIMHSPLTDMNKLQNLLSNGNKEISFIN